MGRNINEGVGLIEKFVTDSQVLLRDINTGLFAEIDNKEENKMEKRNFKVGDKVRRINSRAGGMRVGDIGIVNKEPYVLAGEWNVTVNYRGYVQSHFVRNLELVKSKVGRPAKPKPKPEDLTRYMAYGQGCDNKSGMYSTEKELRQEAKRLRSDSSWSGRIIGYKLVPLFEVESKTVLKSLGRPLKAKRRKRKKK